MLTAEADRPLLGQRVLVTRPAHQAGNLCDLIRAKGGTPVLLPLIEIVPPADPAAARRAVAHLESLDLAIFVSPNAIERVAEWRRPAPWPAQTRTAVVGRGSAEALQRHGIPAHIWPVEDFTSEGLLAEPALKAVAGWEVALFRGDPGRDVLAPALRRRGARVTEVEVYRRRLPPAAPAGLAAVSRQAPLDAIVVTSNHSLSNLVQAAGESLGSWLRDQQLVVISRRAADLASAERFGRPARVAPEASDAGLLQALCNRQ